MQQSPKRGYVRPLIALGLLGASALGGAYALWSDSSSVDGGTITSGNLDLEAISTTAQDVTEYRADGPHAIDLATWRMVPGDTVQIDSQLDIALEGDNLTATLGTAGVDAILGTTDPAIAQYVTYDVQILDAAGNVIADTDTAGGVATVNLMADSVGQQAGTDHEGFAIVSSDTIDGTADATARITVNFSADTPDQVLTQTQLADLTGNAIELTQIQTP